MGHYNPSRASRASAALKVFKARRRTLSKDERELLEDACTGGYDLLAPASSSWTIRMLLDLLAEAEAEPRASVPARDK
jgi:hypothetical protein